MTKSVNTRTRVGGVALWCAAVLGALCAIVTLAGVLGGYSLVLFRTGSMSPTIPTGSIAVVHRVAADEVRTGDVVTVQLPGHEPVTHRVVSTAPVPGAGHEQRALTLKGDANVEPDPRPYQVSEVRQVVFSVPGGAQLIAALSQPSARIVGALLAAGIIAWALWPARSVPRTTRPSTNA